MPVLRFMASDYPFDIFNLSHCIDNKDYLFYNGYCFIEKGTTLYVPNIEHNYDHHDDPVIFFNFPERFISR